MKYIKRLLLFVLIFALVCMTVGCSDKENDGTSTEINKDLESIKSEIEDQKTDISGMDFEFTDREKNSSYDKSDAVAVKFSDTSVEISGQGAVAEKTKVNISKAGTYIITGKTADGMLVVECSNSEKVQLVLDNIDISNKTGPAIYIKEADKVFVTLSENSVNTLNDGESYEFTDGETNVDGTIFSKADVAFNGSGSLNVNGNNKHGIVSKDDLVITGGSYNITSKGVALNGKDCVKIADGAFVFNAGTDGIRSDNEEESDRGYVYISGGDFKIESGNDGIQAQTVLSIDGGTFDIASGGGSKNASTNQNGDVNENWGFGGDDFGGRPGGIRPGFRPTSYTHTGYPVTSDSSTTESAKGIKSGSDIIISGGSFNIDSADDSVHSNGTLEIQNGTFVILSGDDGIHADTALTVKDGSITVNKSYEGLESSDIVISGGKISVVSSDDGMNAAGGNDGSSMNNRPGMNGFTNSSGRIVIENGYTVIDASGDGIDANGSITVSGGVTIVYGPTNSGNGSLDYDSTASITGGTFIALGSSGMAMGFSSAENQGAITTSVTSQSKGSTLAICDESDNVVLCVNAKKAYSHIVVSCKGIQSDNEYTFVAGSQIENTDENGYAENTTKNGGSVLVKIPLTSNLYGSSGGMGGMGGRR